jgi:tryptophan-rich sensory protein
MTKFIAPIIFIIVSQAAGIVGAVFTSPAIPNWYASLNKPSFNPPGWIFGPVWTILYTMMGLAAWLVWQKWGESSVAKAAVILFFVHLVFNTLWSILFFGLQNPMLAFIEILFLWGMILALIILFYQVDKRAAYLMIPYILWVSFAAVLNFSIWRLN